MTAVRAVSAAERRASLVARHRLDGSAASVLDAIDSVFALHATDPASVYLSVLARCAIATLDDVRTELHDRRSLVRWMAMRRTLFVFRWADVPMIHAAVGVPLAGMLRRQLVSLVTRNGLDRPLEGDPEEWLDRVAADAADALRAAGSATGAELSTAVPRLRSAIPPRAPSERPRTLTSPLLTLMGVEGRIVRGDPVGAWTTRAARWEPVETWWPDGLEIQDPAEAEATLARRWLERFGPATLDDLQWWTGWGKRTTAAAIARLGDAVEEVDLDGRPGIDLAGAETPEPSAPVACLLPSLDPTPMGWRDRDWFTAVDPRAIYDPARNIGPTIWWDGEIVGSWAAAADGVRTRLLVDRGRDAAAAIDSAAEALGERLAGTPVIPAARTPTERELTTP